jgi:hypothetical protein
LTEKEKFYIRIKDSKEVASFKLKIKEEILSQEERK